jgi:putative heme-binding domain-containing protein
VIDHGSVRRALLGILERGEKHPLTPALKDQLSLALFGPERTPDRSGARPNSEEAWIQSASQDGDAENGRRVFFHPTAACSTCHRIEGRGGLTGPDLSVIGRSLDRAKLVQSILKPSRDIAPQFVAQTIQTRGGESHTGLVQRRDSDGSITLLPADGRKMMVLGGDITSVEPSAVSLMPEGLENSLTVHDFRDLMVFLNSLR